MALARATVIAAVLIACTLAVHPPKQGKQTTHHSPTLATAVANLEHDLNNLHALEAIGQGTIDIDGYDVQVTTYGSPNDIIEANSEPKVEARDYITALDTCLEEDLTDILPAFLRGIESKWWHDPYWNGDAEKVCLGGQFPVVPNSFYLTDDEGECDYEKAADPGPQESIRERLFKTNKQNLLMLSTSCLRNKQKEVLEGVDNVATVLTRYRAHLVKKDSESGDNIKWFCDTDNQVVIVEPHQGKHCPGRWPGYNAQYGTLFTDIDGHNHADFTKLVEYWNAAKPNAVTDEVHADLIINVGEEVGQGDETRVRIQYHHKTDKLMNADKFTSPDPAYACDTPARHGFGYWSMHMYPIP